MDRIVDEKPRENGNGSSRQKESRLDAERFEEVYRNGQGRLVQRLAAIVGDRERAEDIAARAFQIAWEKREQFRGDASASTWVQAIAQNEARDSWKTERRAQADSLDGASTPEAPAREAPTDEWERQEDRERLKAALERVPIKHRRALVEHLVNGHPVRDIAQREQVPVGTVLSRIFTAKQLLRHAWNNPVPAAQQAVSSTQLASGQPQKQGSPGSGRSQPEQSKTLESTWDR